MERFGINASSGNWGDMAKKTIGCDPKHDL